MAGLLMHVHVDSGYRGCKPKPPKFPSKLRYKYDRSERLGMFLCATTGRRERTALIPAFFHHSRRIHYSLSVANGKITPRAIKNSGRNNTRRTMINPGFVVSAKPSLSSMVATAFTANAMSLFSAHWGRSIQFGTPRMWLWRKFRRFGLITPSSELRGMGRTDHCSG